MEIRNQQSSSLNQRFVWVWDVLLIGIIILGAYFRTVGLNWDENTHMHPDERFLTMVATSIEPVKNLSEYFDTENSTLNPHNRGYGFYVYGTLPMFIVRYIAEWVGQTGYDQIHLVGRQVSAIFDLGTVLVVFLIASRLYRKPRLALIAALFYAFAVLPIQLSHFFKEDTFMTFFATLTVYFAIRILPLDGEKWEDQFDLSSINFSWLRFWESAIPFIFFGLSLGMAMASKINSAPLALLLPVALGIRYFSFTEEKREQIFGVYIRNLIFAAIVAFITFRIFQPYAFSGPGFFNVSINPKWLANMKELASQNSGDVDFPPQLQWARRPFWFALQNMVLWGLGAPLGVWAWVSFLLMGWMIIKGEWRKHLLLWGWTGIYFIWQSSSATPSMRYLMPIYPTMSIIASWGIFSLWEYFKSKPLPLRGFKTLVAGLGGLVVISTFLWAVAFIQIYRSPFTRVEASRWIYQNVPGPINLQIQTDQNLVNQPVSFDYGYSLTPNPMKVLVTPFQSGNLVTLEIPHVKDRRADPDMATLIIHVLDAESGDLLSSGLITDVFKPEGDPRGKSYTVTLDSPVYLESDHSYFIEFISAIPEAELELAGPTLLVIQNQNGTYRQPLPEPVRAIREGQQFVTGFRPIKNGTLTKIYFHHVVDWEAGSGNKTIRVVVRSNEENPQISSGRITGTFLPVKDYRGEGYWVTLDSPVNLSIDKSYSLEIALESGSGQIAIYGSKQAIETSWDDALPLGVDGYSPYDFNSGVYRSDLNFEMYWDDNPEKLQRFLTILEQADYIFISSNRQWGTTIRVPERYPLTTKYYQKLLGCPETEDLFTCYANAQPGMYDGELGFELVKVVQSEPRLGNLWFNSQFAEEAFSVYDHPKVLIFQKSAKYDRNKVKEILSAVDLSLVVHLTPKQAGKYPGNLLLPPDRRAAQLESGTWQELFNRQSWINRYPILTVLVWYLFIAVLGWITYPVVRVVFKTLPDKGFPLSRLTGLLLLAYLVWLGGSHKIPVSREMITIVMFSLLTIGLISGFLQRKSILQELRENGRHYLIAEGVFATFFLLFLLVRLGNPDLWHPWKGGEKPMDFSYFNAILKSIYFPPYDPWFAGGYINYYYYGFVLVGIPVKWLGIVPSVAYNLILPTLYGLLALGAFSFVWNTLVKINQKHGLNISPYGYSFLGVLLLQVAGNLGTLRMIWHGLMRLASPAPQVLEANLIQKITWTVQGLGKYLTGAVLPYPRGEWYWIPSRAFPANTGDPITEFPAFTFLYADLHAHMIALPVTVLALCWALSILFKRWEDEERLSLRNFLEFVFSLFIGGLIVGALKTTNTWDYPTYLALGSLAVIYNLFKSNSVNWLRGNLSVIVRKGIFALVSLGLFVGFSFVLYAPFSQWYGQGYSELIPYQGLRTPSWSYLTHWGLFFFLIIAWMGWESINWMASTPVSALRKLSPYKDLLYLGLLVFLGTLIGLLLMKVHIAWLAFPLAVWAGILMLRPGIPDAKRAVYFMIGTALVLTLFVELFTLRGDINRMNTVFKFYLQAWTLLSLASAIALGVSHPHVETRWNPSWRTAWYLLGTFLFASALLFPLMGGMDKIRDRMSPFAPHTLDGMAYMPYSTYNESGVDLVLKEDYQAIIWMQENISGTPVIVEGHVPEYRWGNRYAIYTGLPAVVGWNWHQRQQRALTPESWVTDRVRAVADFYTLSDEQFAEAFIKKYQVRYIIVGVLERAIYPPEGLAKFERLNGILWDEVYRNGQTVIYQVRD
ncbi:DUF2298 domain-containing protein [uncultured Anaerolinea sp.]|nr:DUF2298 domain-containing protein [uncultured Anaerolinea sp.]